MATSTYRASPPRRRYPDVPIGFLPAGIALAGLAIGILAAFRPELAVGAVLALALVPLVLTRPIVGLCALVFLSFLEEYSAMTGVVSGTKILGGMLALAWLAVVATSDPHDRQRRGLFSREPALAAALTLFAAWACMSLVWAEVPEAAQSSVFRFLLSFLLFPIALVALRTPRHVIWLVAVFVVGSFVAVAFGLLTGSMEAAEEQRLKGAGLNPNQLGTYLVASMVLMGTLAANHRWSPLARAAVLLVAVLGGLAVFMTLSRGALVGLGAALVVAPFVIGRGRRLGALVLVVVTVVGTLGWYTAIAPAHAVDRITHPERGGGSGREDLWRVGWRMVEDRPVHGVGAGNFPESSIHYLLRPGSTQRDEIIVDDKKVAHNIYLTVLSELGAVGLGLFVVILFVCLRCALRAAWRFAERDDLLMELVARGLFIALVSLLVADFFSSALYSKQLWVLLAMAPALLAMAERPVPALRAQLTRLWRRQPAPARAVS
jgi:exopolysaccharide production protein ExoQ